MSEPCCMSAAHDHKCTCSKQDEIATAYGLLWHMFIDRRDRNLLAASTARTHLSNVLTKEQKQRGIVLARERIRRMGHDPDAMLRDPDIQAAAAALWEKP